MSASAASVNAIQTSYLTPQLFHPLLPDKNQPPKTPPPDLVTAILIILTRLNIFPSAVISGNDLASANASASPCFYLPQRTRHWRARYQLFPQKKSSGRFGVRTQLRIFTSHCNVQKQSSHRTFLVLRLWWMLPSIEQISVRKSDADGKEGRSGGGW